MAYKSESIAVSERRRISSQVQENPNVKHSGYYRYGNLVGPAVSPCT